MAFLPVAVLVKLQLLLYYIFSILSFSVIAANVDYTGTAQAWLKSCHSNRAHLCCQLKLHAARQLRQHLGNSASFKTAQVGMCRTSQLTAETLVYILILIGSIW